MEDKGIPVSKPIKAYEADSVELAYAGALINIKITARNTDDKYEFALPALKGLISDIEKEMRLTGYNVFTITEK